MGEHQVGVRRRMYGLCVEHVPGVHKQRIPVLFQ